MTFVLRPEQTAVLARSYSVAQIEALLAPRGVDVSSAPENGSLQLRDGAGRLCWLSLDDRGRVVRIVTPNKREQQFRYSGENLLTGYRSALGQQFAWQYDARDRPVVLDDGAGRWRFEWDQFNNLGRIDHPEGTAAEIAWAAPNLLQAYRDRTGGVVRLERDEKARITAVIHPNRQVTRFAFGDFDQPDKVTRPDGSTEGWERNSEGRIAKTWRNGVPHARIRWTAGGHLQALAFADGGHASFGYDDVGRMTSAVNASASVARTFDDSGHLLTDTQGEATVAFEYDPTGLLLKVTLPSGEGSEFTYDDSGELASVKDWTGASHGIERSADGRTETYRLANGVVQEVRHLRTGAPRAVEVKLPAPGGEPLSLRMGYDSEGRVREVEDSEAGARRFSYDAEGRLTGVFTQDRLEESYAYDPNGNRKSGLHSAVDEMVWDGARRITYDAAGNVTLTQGPAGATRYTFDAQNLLTRVDLPDGRSVEYAYDALARRTQKRCDGATTHYLWGGDQLLSEWTEDENGASSSTCDYLYLPGSALPFAMRCNGAVVHCHGDHLGTPRWLTDASGAVVWSGTFEAFGAAARIQGAVRQPLRFPGQYFDEETGLHYNRARYYSPQLGRYLSRDPLDLPAGTNLYVYAGNDPINGSDPLGLLSGWGKFAVAAGLVAIGVAAIVVAGPILLAGAAAVAAGTAVASGTALAAAGLVAGTAVLGAGIGLGLAPDGCWPCQLAAMNQGALAGAGAALMVLGVLFTGGAAAAPMLAFSTGGIMTTAAGSALGAGMSAMAGGILLMSQASKSGGKSGSSSDESSSSSGKAKRVDNPKHNPNSKSPQPKNVDELYDKSIDDGTGTRWAKDDDGTIHRFSRPSNGETHWNGSTAGDKPISPNDIPNPIKKALK